MRVRDDPRAAAELFCSQNGVTDEETIDLLEDTLRRLYLPSSSYPPPLSSIQSPALPAEASTTKSWPPASENAGDPVGFPGRDHATRGGGTSTDYAEDAVVRTPSSTASGGAGEDGAHDAGGTVHALSDPAAAVVASDAVGATQRAANWPHQDQHDQRQHRQRNQDTHNDDHESISRTNNEPAEEMAEAAAAVAATPAAESPSAEIDVIAVAARMRDTLKAFHDPADPSSVMVDLVVNGHPAPLVFRIPRKSRRTRHDRHHSEVENVHTGHSEGGRGEVAADDANDSSGQEQRNEGGVDEEAGERGGQTKEELQEEAVAVAAREWCGAFGSVRAEDIAFVEAEIRKAVAAAEAATAATATATAAAAAGDPVSDGSPSASAEATQNGQRDILERPEAAGVLSRTGDEPDARVTRQEEHATAGSTANKDGRERSKRLTINSILAPDVEKGTSMFWVKVDPGLPELFVIAGSSALELSEGFCRDHNLGPSQVPLVAWKVVEAYPLQMEATRRGGTVPPAEVTLGYAAGQREVQMAFVLLVVAILWATCWRLFGRLGRGKPAAAGPRQRRRKRGPISTKLWTFVSPVLPTWASWQPKQSSRGQKIATLSRDQKEMKLVSDARDPRGAADAPPSLPNNGTAASWTTVESTKTDDGDEATGGYLNGSGGDDPRRGPHEPLSSRLLSWVDAVLFEAGRIVGASIRVVVYPLARVLGAPSEASVPSKAGETEPDIPSAASAKAGAQPRNSKGSRSKASKGSGNSAKTTGGAMPAKAVARAPTKPSPGVSDSTADKEAAPFAGGDVQRAAEGADARTKNGSEASAAGETAAAQTAGCSDRREHGTLTSVLAGLNKDQSNRFLETAILSNAGHILARSDAFTIETHEACDWMRLFKNKKGDIIVGGHKFVVLSRDEGSIIVSSKTLGSKMIGSKTRSGSAVIGVYADLSKSEARENMALLVDALASAAVR
eukprot:g10011.t1